MEKISKITANAHTHTTYCDGKCSAEEMILGAIGKGLTCLGFSGHCYTWFDESYAMSRENTEQYRKEILELKEKYRGTIDIVLGTEWDGDARDLDPKEYEYTLGSCHYVYGETTGRYYTVDYTIEELQACKDEAFHGDGMAMVRAYYEAMIRMVQNRKPTIVGHLDLIRKLNAGNRFFDETSEDYLQIAKEAAKVCVDSGCIIEINTGGVYRRYRNTPYPAEPILRYINDLGGKVTINSDCHDIEGIDYMFPQTLELMKRCGFRTVWQLTAEGMKEYEIL
ncbi:MAG: histidinol-phosphatase [Firmicutes bacterium]|nr:histidinol-phosphatase [Bacillota bacterium]